MALCGLVYAVGLLTLITSGSTLGEHSIAINTSPEPLTNIAASLGEDGLAFGVVLLSIYYPIAAIVAVLILLALTVYLLPKIIRVIWAAFGRLKRILGWRPWARSTPALIDCGY